MKQKWEHEAVNIRKLRSNKPQLILGSIKKVELTKFQGTVRRNREFTGETVPGILGRL